MADALRLIDRQSDTTTAAPGAARTPRPVPEAEAFVTTDYTFADTLTTNPAGSRRFLQVGVTLSTQYDAKVMTHVETHSAALRSDMLAVIGSFSEDEIAGREGREALAVALRDAINARLETLEGFGGIEGVFFPSFVLQ
jgi:flagellar FliL protein